MIDPDTFILERSYQPQENEYLFADKQYLPCPDQNNGAYGNGMINFYLSELATSDRLADLYSSYIHVPLVMALQITGNTFAQTPSNAFAMSLKNGNHQLVHMMTITMNNNDIVQSATYHNLKINYEILSSYSDETVKNFGASTGFHGKDSTESWNYQGTSTSVGLGECNNQLIETRTLTTAPYTRSAPGTFVIDSGCGSYHNGNDGRKKRMLESTSFDPANIVGNGAARFTDAGKCDTVAKNYCVPLSTNATEIIYYINAILPCSMLHDFFRKCPLVKGAKIKITLFMNTQCYTKVSVPASVGANLGSDRVYGAVTANVSPYGVIPFQLSPLTTFQADGLAQGVSLTPVVAATAATFAAATLTASLGIGRSLFTINGAYQAHPTKSQCTFYAATYKLSPLQEERYFSSYSKKKILFNDHSCFCNEARFQNIAANTGNVNCQLTAGQSRLRSLLIIPYLSASVHGSAITALTTTYAGNGIFGSPLQSPFSSSPGTLAAYARIKNLQVNIGATPYFNTPINYGFEQYYNEIRGSNSAYGGKMREISSGLLSQPDWESLYPFVYIDLSNHTLSEAYDNIPRSVNVSFTNASNANIDYWIFLNYQREFSIGIDGSIVI